MSFLKPPVFVKTILLSCALFASMFFNSCKQLTSFDPNVDGVRVAVNDAFSAPADVKATHGLKQKISLEWLPVSGARYYDIYSAESATAEFKKIGETDKNSFDDRVGAGRTLYYRVCAVKSDGTQSASSATVKGTSLAAPVISGGDVSDCSATISWFMENARAVDGTDNYEGSLIFVVHWQQKNGGTPNEKTLAAAKDFTNSFYEWTIKNLSGASDYEFWIEAYLSGDQTNNENSPKVDKKTLTSYTPLAPEFRATQGESAQGVWLYITLPENVMVQTETKDSPNEKRDEPYPLKFEISRAIGEIGEDDSGASWETVCKYLYYNGTTTPPEYTESESSYNAGDEIEWFDESANLVGGEKYTYRIRSFVDTGYSKVVCPEGKEYNGNPSTPPEKASKALGWKSAHPSFKVNYSRTLSTGDAKVLSYELRFGAEWNDLGKAGEYKFAIKQIHTSWNGSSKGEFLKNGEGIFFETLDEIKSLVKTFGSASGLSDAEQGSYFYTLYVVSKNCTKTEDLKEDDADVLDTVSARDGVVVTSEVNLPKAELSVEDGYTDKVKLVVSSLEKDVKYSVTRTRLEDGKLTTDVKDIDLSTLSMPESGSFEYADSKDNGLQSNCAYSYVLKASAASGVFSLSPAKEAETLGTPKVSFEKERLCYDSVTISFDGVLAAKKYTVTLGAAGGFGGGETFEITKGGDEWNSASVSISPSGNATATAKVTLAPNKFTVTIEKPYGYDDARLAGMTANAIVTAHSGVDSASGSEQVNVLGPACLEVKVNSYEDATENSITLTWKAVEGANGYLIKRVMYEDTEMKNVANGSGVTYYYEVASKKITADGDGEAIGDRAKVEPSGDQFTLTDTYMEITTSDETLKEYQEKQAKIALGLPFRYVVLPVFEKTDFDFKSGSLDLDVGKVAYKNFEETKTDGVATWGYGLFVDADKSVSATTQNIAWSRPFYGDRLTPRVYRRKFANRNKNEWDYVNYNINENSDGMKYPVTGDDRYCAWEYAVKYSKNSSNTIVPSYVEYLKNSNHDETRYDYGTSEKEKRNKGYLLAMKMTAEYGGKGLSSDNPDYYSEDVTITPWDYEDRALGPANVEIKVLSLDLADGWQSVGSLDSKIEGITKNEALFDTTVDFKKVGQKVKLKPTEISNNHNGKGTTNGPLKILRSAKHYYGLNLARVGNDPIFDDNNYEVYAYRQITDEELIKSTMLVLVSLFSETSMSNDTYTTWAVDGANNTKDTYAGYDGSTLFRWGQGSNSKLYWQLNELHWGWKKMPCGEDIFKRSADYYSATNKVKHFMTIADREALTSTKLRGHKYGKTLEVLGTNDSFSDNNNYIPFTVTFDSDFVNAVSGNKNANVYFTADVKNGKFWAYVSDRNNTFTANNSDIYWWIPFYKGSYYNEDSNYGWWN